MTQKSKEILVEVWSDFVCPFCYIGKRNLDTALARFEGRESVRVVYRSFELDRVAKKGKAGGIYEFLADKYGQSVEWARVQNARVTQMAQSVGLKYEMDRVMPNNSFAAHRLSHWAASKGKKDGKSAQASWIERVLAAHFSEGQDISDAKTLARLAAEVGLDAQEAEQVAVDPSLFESEVRGDETEAQDLGVTGVPFFVVNRRVAVSGAQPPDALLKMLGEEASNIP